MGLSFVPVTIASLTGVERADAGVASGLVNTSRQIGGAIGHRRDQRDRRHVDEHLRRYSRAPASSAVALDHGYQTALYTMLALLLGGVALVTAFVGPQRRPTAATPDAQHDVPALDEAA